MTPRAELLARIDDVAYARVQGSTFADVVKFAAEKGWTVSRDDLLRMVRIADRRVLRDQRVLPTNSLAMHRARREMLFSRAVLEGDYKTALAALKELALIDGVYPAKKPGRGELPGPLVNLNLTVSDERKSRLLEALDQEGEEGTPRADDAGRGGGTGAPPGAGDGQEGAEGV